MLYLLVLCVIFGLSLDNASACGPDPSKWTPQERQMYECLKGKGWSNEQMMSYYNRVFNPQTRSGRATRSDQALVRGCLTIEDFLHYGVTPDGYTPPTTPPPADTFADMSWKERHILVCLRRRGLSDVQLRAWYNSALNPKSRSGRVSRHDQELARGCIDDDGFLYFGVTPDGYTTTTTTTAPTTIAPTTSAPTTPSSTTPSTEILTAETTREKRIFDCLRAKRWSDKWIRTWYNRVLNPESNSGRATLYDQDRVSGCVDISDYLYYGVKPDGYTPTTPLTPATQPTTTSTMTPEPTTPIPQSPTVYGDLPPSA